ncbi:CUE domain-containing protein 3 [Podospora fimiseda]|uniref:CUE domain-containing protein 3 n=1 Tax=Podospora fimiseda TaxID=252190 RepID=A0AAN7GT29_9PEZI|nr:CUE domain-containing protein 3 [Podospora fimiseda]
MDSSGLPSFAVFPIFAWREQLVPDEWVACLDAWLALIDSHLSLSEAEFSKITTKDESVPAFLTSFTQETAQHGAGIIGSSSSAKQLLKDSLQLTTKLLQSSSPPSDLTKWEFLADFCRLYGKKKGAAVFSSLSASSQRFLDASLANLKKFLTQNLDDGLNGGDLKGIQERLEGISDLINSSPAIAEFFLAGSDFLDGLINCYKITNPPLRKALISTTYLCLVGLAEGQKFSALTDQLYSLKAAAEAHKTGPLNVNDSLVAELVTSTPLTQQLLRKLEESSEGGAVPSRTKSILTELDTYKKPNSTLSKPKRLIRRKIDKGKGVVLLAEAHAEHQQEIHIHRMTQITQIQDLFPELGSGFIAKLLDEYGDNNTEEVISHLLDDSLPSHLQSADRSEQLFTPTTHASSLPPKPTPPFKPTYLPSDDDDNDDEDLALLTSSNLQLGKNKRITADTLLKAPTTSSQKASILSALAAFDSDDDERDDTYDAADVGGTVDTSTQDEIIPDGAEAHLYRAYISNPKLFERSPVSRRSNERAQLKEITGGMSDEQIEGWGVMLARDPATQKRLGRRYGEWDGKQIVEIEGSKNRWKEEDGEEGESGSDFVGGGRGGHRGRGRGGRGGGGGNNRPPPDSEVARRRKEANKGHNRRDQRAKKMARGGFAG